MEIQIRRYSLDLNRQPLATNYSKAFDEIPTFEEAFDPASLRKFFQEYESTNSQSAYSPHKDRFPLDEGHSQSAFDNDFLMSPPMQFLSDFQSESEHKTSKPHFSFNFNLGPKGLSVKPSSPGYVAQAALGTPFTINQLLKRSPGKELEIPPNIDRDSVEKIESPFEKKLRNKQIFKIIRESKMKDTPLNVKRKHSAPSGENIDKLVKRVKSLSNTRRLSAGDSSVTSSKGAKQNDTTSMSSGFSNL